MLPHLASTPDRDPTLIYSDHTGPRRMEPTSAGTNSVSRGGLRGLSPCQQIPDIGAVSTPTPLADTTLRKAIILLSILAMGTLLYFAQDVFIPVAVALFLALLLSPAVDRLQKWHIRRPLAVAIVI